MHLSIGPENRLSVENLFSWMTNIQVCAGTGPILRFISSHQRSPSVFVLFDLCFQLQGSDSEPRWSPDSPTPTNPPSFTDFRTPSTPTDSFPVCGLPSLPSVPLSGRPSRASSSTRSGFRTELCSSSSRNFSRFSSWLDSSASSLSGQ